MLRIVSGLVVFAGCGYIGICMAANFKKRVRQLKELQNAMTQLEYSIDFSGITLSDAFERIAHNTETSLKSVFLYVSQRLKANPGSDMKSVWKRAIDKWRDELALTESDIEIIKDFSEVLGEGNREKEKNNIKITAMRLSMAVDEAISERDRNVKMYRGLGFLVGIFIVIVLI